MKKVKLCVLFLLAGCNGGDEGFDPSELEERISSMATAIETQRTEIAELKARTDALVEIDQNVEGLESRTKALETQSSALGARANVLETQSASLDDRIAAIEPRMSAMSGGPVGEVILWFADGGCPDGFIKLDGSSYDPTVLSGLDGVLAGAYGPGLLPDPRGLFLRVLDDGAGQDPGAATRSDRGDGTTGDAVGTLQADATAVNELKILTGGRHDHEVDPVVTGTSTATVGSPGGDCNDFGGGCDPGREIEQSSSPRRTWTDSDGEHSHDLEGDAETRPSNIAVQLCIRTRP